MYGRYFYDNSTTQFYKYNPLLHGPFLYHFIPWMYFFLGVTKFALRFPMALIGSTFIFLPFLWRSYISPKTVIVTTAIIATSPTLIYWSRFCRHDSFVLLWITLTLLCISHIKKSVWRIPLIAILIALMFSTKENSYVHLVLILSFYLYKSVFLKVVKINYSLFEIISNSLKQNKVWYLTAISLFVFVFSYYYSAGFQYSKGILDGLYRESVFYWLNQHSIERIPGPFAFQFFSLTWYELIFTGGLFVYLINFYNKRSFSGKLSLAIILIISLIIRIVIPEPSTNNFIYQVLKIKIPFDYYLFFFYIFHAVYSTSVHLKRRENLLALFGYLFFSTLFTYSYLGEKVPWLTLYPLFFGTCYLSLYFKNHIEKYRFSAFISLFSVSLLLIYPGGLKSLLSGSSREHISQVQTTPQYEKIGVKIREEISKSKGSLKPNVLALKDNIWPMTWFLYGHPEYVYNSKNKDPKTFDYVLSPHPNIRLMEELRESHFIEEVPLRWWWLPDYKKISLTKYLEYMFLRKTWNPPGSQKVIVFKRK